MKNLPTQNISIDLESPWDDSLGREKFGQFFCRLLLTTATPTVIELSAGYGEGKTTFIHRCLVEFTKKAPKTKIFYINIWEQDFDDNPFLAILRVLDEYYGFKNFIDKNKENIHSIAKIGARILSSGAIDIGNIIPEDKEKTPHDFILEVRKIINKKHNGNDGRTIIILDELDRCRPDYAIRTLEVIKHVFNTEGVVFVLSTDDSRLQSAVHSVYGSQVANEDYLRKFVDIQLYLPEISGEERRYLCDIFNTGDVTLKATLREMGSINYFMSKYNAKDVKYFDHRQLSFIRSTGSDSLYLFYTAVKFMIYLRHIKPNFYFQIGQGNVNVDQLISNLKFMGYRNELILNQEKFNTFVKFICNDKSKNTKLYNELFTISEVAHIKKLDVSSVENLENFNDTSVDLQNSVRSDVETFNKKIQENGLFIHMHSNLGRAKDGLTKAIYEVIESV